MNYNLPNSQLTNENLNSIGSQYAVDFNHETSLKVRKITNEMIFDSSPQQFFDLAMMNQLERVNSVSDEFFYQEMGYQRSPLTATGTALGVSWPATQTFTISNIADIATDFIIIYPDNTKANVVAINTTTGAITVQPNTNGSVPAVAVSDEFAILSSVEADGIDGFANYFRASIIERYQYIQQFSKAIRYGRTELYKMQNAGTTKNFLSMERKMMLKNFRLEMSNAFWNGERGETTTANGNRPAKLTGGIFPAMVAAGAPNVTAPVSMIGAAVEDIALNSEFGDFGETRFLYGRNRAILEVGKYYKDEKTRYTPDNKIADLGLDMVNIGSTKIILVPFERFADRSSFPSSFANRLVLVDPKNIKLREMWGFEAGDTLQRKDGIPKTYGEYYLSGNFGVEFNNPLACGYVDVTGL